MTYLRPVPALPPLRLDASRGTMRRGLPHLAFLLRGLMIVVALALPALGARLRDPTEPGAMQAAIVPSPPPARTMAALTAR